MILSFTIFATTTLSNNIMVGFINPDLSSNTIFLKRENLYSYFMEIAKTLKDLKVNVNSITLMFKGEDSLSYLMLDAFAEVMQEYKCEYTFHDPSKTLFYRMSNIELIIFGFNFLGYEDNITEDCNAFEDSSPDINAEKDILEEDFGNGGIRIDNLNVDNTSTALLGFSLLILINFLLIPFLCWLLDGNILTDQSIDSIIFSSFIPFFRNRNFWDYLSFFTFWLIFLWWIFAWTILIFNLLLGVNYLFWYIYVFLIKFFPFF